MPVEDLRARIDAYLAASPNQVARERVAEQSALELSEGSRREISILLAGTGRDAGLDRMVEFLGEGYGVPIRVVTFQVLDLGSGEQLLLREAREVAAPDAQRRAGAYSWEGVLANAEQAGVGDQMRALRAAAERLGLHPRPWKVSLMLTPMQNKTRYLFSFWPKERPTGALGAIFSPEALSEFFPLTVEQIVEVLGADQRRSLDPSGVRDGWSPNLLRDPCSRQRATRSPPSRRVGLRSGPRRADLRDAPQSRRGRPPKPTLHN
jgi:hypothetical protein